MNRQQADTICDLASRGYVAQRTRHGGYGTVTIDVRRRLTEGELHIVIRRDGSYGLPVRNQIEADNKKGH